MAELARHHYFDAVNEFSQLVDVTYEEGVCIARFLEPEDEDGEVVCLLSDMTGLFEPPIKEPPARRPRG